MKKISIFLLTAFGSSWFLPVSFFIGTRSGMEAICWHQHCARDMAVGDAPDRLFSVMVRLPSDRNKVISVLLEELQRFLENNPDATLEMLADKGEADGGWWEYSVEFKDADRQIIHASYVDGNSISVKYQTEGHSIEPLSSKVMNSGYTFASAPFGVLVAMLIKFFSRRLSIKLNTGKGN